MQHTRRGELCVVAFVSRARVAELVDGQNVCAATDFTAS
jgi:hypothetical protein